MRETAEVREGKMAERERERSRKDLSGLHWREEGYVQDGVATLAVQKAAGG